MKKTIFVFLIITMIIGGWKREKKLHIEGVWKLIYSSSFNGDPTIKTSQIKTWLNGYYTFVGQYEKGNTPFEYKYGAGTYKLEGNRCEYTRIYHWKDVDRDKE
jgi:hypothetical protein